MASDACGTTSSLCAHGAQKYCSERSSGKGTAPNVKRLAYRMVNLALSASSKMCVCVRSSTNSGVASSPPTRDSIPGAFLTPRQCLSGILLGDALLSMACQECFHEQQLLLAECLRRQQRRRPRTSK